MSAVEVPTAELPRVPLVPAPWTLQGHAWIVLLRLSRHDGARTAFLPPYLRGSVAAPGSVLMYVDYAQAPCGPYRELLFVPGATRFGDGRRHPTINRILVSTWDSVVNGRRNWGIPKDRADFDEERTRDGDSLTVRDEAGTLCTLEFGAPHGPRLPLDTRFVPSALTNLAQSFDGATYYYRPSARGTARLCRLVSIRSDGRRFPNLSAARVLACLRVDRFDMTFPVARVTPLPIGS